MSKVKVLDIGEYLPTYYIENKQIVSSKDGQEKVIGEFDSDIERQMKENEKEEVNQNALHNEEEENLDWVQGNKELGDYGEKIALAYLKSVESDVKVVAEQASKGYDIEINREGKIIGVEVKTSKSKKGFHITLNELRRANEKQDDYWLIFIEVDEETKKNTGYLIKNLIQTFKIDFNEITNIMEKPNIFLKPNKFFIQFKSDWIQAQSPLFNNIKIK